MSFNCNLICSEPYCNRNIQLYCDWHSDNEYEEKKIEDSFWCDSCGESVTIHKSKINICKGYQNFNCEINLCDRCHWCEECNIQIERFKHEFKETKNIAIDSIKGSRYVNHMLTTVVSELRSEILYLRTERELIKYMPRVLVDITMLKIN
jgi:hypothetical protein